MRARAALRAALAVAAVAAAAAAAATPAAGPGAPAWAVPEVGFAGLLEDDADNAAAAATKTLRRALAEHGVVALRDIPGLADLRKLAFTAAAECLPTLEDATRVDLADGTRRVSVGARTVAHALQDWQDADLAASSLPACVEMRRLGQRLRRAVQAAEHLFVSRLDDICQTAAREVDIPRASEGEVRVRSGRDADPRPVRDFIMAGSQLEHLHLYSRGEAERPSATDAGADMDTPLAALDLHEDAGLFILFVPAMHVGEKGSAGATVDGFTLELASGERVTPVFPDDGNVVVAMVGAAFERLVNPATQVPLRAVPHELRLAHGATRAWFGKMFLPPADALYAAENKSFADVHAAQVRAVRSQTAASALTSGSSASMGCTDIFAMATDQNGGCKSDELYCWMKCMKKPTTCGTSKEARCVHPNGDAWNSATHCTECAPRCVAKHHNQSVIGNDFCNGQGTVMYMERLVGWADRDEACIVLLLEYFTLDTRLKFIAGMVAVFLFGICTELLGFARRRVEKKARSGPGSKRVTIARVGLHFVQLAFAYIAMLFAMTYSVPIMLSIVTGLATGHALFNMHQPVTEHTEPCCAITCDETASTESCNDYAEPLLSQGDRDGAEAAVHPRCCSD